MQACKQTKKTEGRKRDEKRGIKTSFSFILKYFFSLSSLLFFPFPFNNSFFVCHLLFLSFITSIVTSSLMLPLLLLCVFLLNKYFPLFLLKHLYLLFLFLPRITGVRVVWESTVSSETLCHPQHISHSHRFRSTRFLLHFLLLLCSSSLEMMMRKQKLHFASDFRAFLCNFQAFKMKN